MVKSMLHASTIRWATGISIVIALSVCWSLSYAETISDGRHVIGPSTANGTVSSVPTSTEAAVRPMPSASVPVENALVLRSIPTVSKPISVGGTTLMPYIGAGFGGGYATELDRSLNTMQSLSSGSFNAGLKNLFGQQLVPNEVQLGVRFPF